jgi:amino acid transporter
MSGLKKTLRLSDLVFMGLILIQPTAPMPLFGVVSNLAGGHVVSAILLALVGMLFTAISYGRMARLYPSAGSAYTYVGKEVHPTAGFLTGWGMLLDYVINPMICTIWCSKALLNIFPGLPYPLAVVLFVLLFTGLNLRAVSATANTNKWLAIIMLGVVAWMLVATVQFVLANPGIDLLRPFYDPVTFSWSKLSAGTSLAVLTYIGFDAISTLSEETVDAERNVPRATVLVCLLIGALSALEIYAAQLVWPHGEAFPDVDTAYVYAAGRAGGAWLFQTINLTLLVASIGSGAGGQMAGARLLYGMGRDGALPRGFFGTVKESTGVPVKNVLLIGVLALAGALAISYETGALLLNYGAFIGFMGVNLACLRRSERTFWGVAPPAAGLAICFFMWSNLGWTALLLGTAWAVVGSLVAWRRRG